MKRISQSLGLGLALLAATAASPRAADWAVGSGGVIKDFGSIKDYRNAAVPVPAPTPTANYSKDWYVRGDLGTNLAADVSLSSTGNVNTREDDLGKFLFGGVAFGRYIAPSVRAELGFDFRSRKKVSSGGVNYTTTKSVRGDDRDVPVAGGGSVLSRIYDVGVYSATQTESSDTADHNVMFNLYYDFKNSSRFTPYIGGGLGVDFKQYRRSVSQDAVCTGAYMHAEANNTDYPNYPVGFCPSTLPARIQSQEKHNMTGIGLAAAVMTGASYEVAHGIEFDVGYRGIWQGASVSVTASGVSGISKVTVVDRFDHELRTGVRFDLQ